MKKYDYLIIGGGMAADAAVEGIREVDDSGSVAVIGEEPAPPYRRPPLTKGLWTGKIRIGDIDCGTEAKGADVLCGRRVVSLDPEEQRIGDDRGEEFGYNQLLLATGGRPRRFPFSDDGVLYYRTRSDYEYLRKVLDRGDRFAVVGGGFIGSELAAALAMNGKDVTLVHPQAAVCGMMLPARLAEEVSRYFARHGVTVVPHCKPSILSQADGASTLRLENGQVVPADGVVAGIGIEPNTVLAEIAGLAVDDGILVDGELRTSDRRIFAAGDAARFKNPALGRRVRVEHEDNALTMGRTAGRNMAGAAEPYTHLPYFYSDLFDAGYEAVGETHAAYETLSTAGAPEDKGVVFYLERGRVRGVLLWNIFGEVEAARALIREQTAPSRAALLAWAAERGGGDAGGGG